MGSGYIVQRGGGSKPSGTISITENGTVDVTEYAVANVNVKDYSAFKAIVDDSLTEVTAEMLDGITSIGVTAFASCTSLTSITIPSGVTYIGNYTFQHCSSLTSITIPSGVTSIGNYTFYYCSALTSVTVEMITPPPIGAELFTGTHADLVIYVPAGSVEAYKSANRWSAYASRIQAIPST